MKHTIDRYVNMVNVVLFAKTSIVWVENVLGYNNNYTRNACIYSVIISILPFVTMFRYQLIVKLSEYLWTVSLNK